MEEPRPFITPPKADYRAENEFMQLAIDEARAGIYNGEGGPFGCVIVKEGRVVGRGHNRVLACRDSTHHGEIAAIRDAEARLGAYDLSGCEVYTTGEPCMMCLAACIWAGVSRINYGCTIADNSEIGFRDRLMDAMLVKRQNAADLLRELDRPAWSCSANMRRWAGRCIEKAGRVHSHKETWVFSPENQAR